MNTKKCSKCGNNSVIYKGKLISGNSGYEYFVLKCVFCKLNIITNEDGVKDD